MCLDLQPIIQNFLEKSTLKKEEICRKRTMNVNVPMGALGTGIVRLVWSTIGKTGLVLTAGKQGMKTKRNN